VPAITIFGYRVGTWSVGFMRRGWGLFGHHRIGCQLPFLIAKVSVVVDQVVDAFRTSVTGMIGTLPPQYFDVTIQTEVHTTILHGLCFFRWLYRGQACMRMALRVQKQRLFLDDLVGQNLVGLQCQGTNSFCHCNCTGISVTGLGWVDVKG
jgi:hypothetical protein